VDTMETDRPASLNQRYNQRNDESYRTSSAYEGSDFPAEHFVIEYSDRLL
jgi:hypothetical protein